MNSQFLHKTLFLFCAAANFFCGGKGPFAHRMAAMAACGDVTSALGNAFVVEPLSVGPYREKYSFFESSLPEAEGVRVRQAKYLKDKGELLALKALRENGDSDCHAHIKLFFDFLECAHFVTDARERASFVNGWINSFISYDEEENSQAKSVHDHRSLSEALVARKGICDEVARLKLFALEELGTPSEDVRWVSLRAYEDGKFSDIGHSVVLVRVQQKDWILDNDHPDSLGDEAMGVADEKWMASFEKASVLRDPATAFQWACAFGERGTTYVPFLSFNTKQRAVFERQDLSGLSLPQARTFTMSNQILRYLTL